jgi:hypothetical protein
MGPVGFEPTTKGFTTTPAFPPGVDYLFTRARNALPTKAAPTDVWVRDAHACD